MIVAVSSSDLAGSGSARLHGGRHRFEQRFGWKGEGGPRIVRGDDWIVVSAGANSRSWRFSAGLSNGSSLGLIDLAALVSTSPIATAIGRREMAGPRARRCRAAGRGSPRPGGVPCRAGRRRGPCRCRGRFDPSGNCSPRPRHSTPARRWVAITPASPRLRPRHMRLVMAVRRRGGPPRPLRRRPPGRTAAPRRPPPARGTTVARRIEQSAAKAAAQRICPSASSPSRLSTTEARCSRMRPGQPSDVALTMVGGLDRHMAVAVGEGDEIALRVDHHLLHLPGASSRRRSRCDLPLPELPCTSRRVASSSSRSIETGSPVGPTPCPRAPSWTSLWQVADSSPSLRVGRCHRNGAAVTSVHQLLHDRFGFSHFRGVQEGWWSGPWRGVTPSR